MQLREALGISREELAEWAGLSARTIENLERGRDARTSTWLRVLAALQEWIAPEWIWQEVPLPEVRRKPRLNKTERDIVELLENERGTIRCSVKELASWIGRSPRAVYRAQRRLVRWEILRIEHPSQRGRGRKNTYILLKNPLKD